MPATLTAPAAEVEVANAVTITGAGLSATTAYVLTITRATGSITTVALVTDGGGGFTYQFVASTPGAVTFSLAPAAPVVAATLALTAVS